MPERANGDKWLLKREPMFTWDNQWIGVKSRSGSKLRPSRPVVLGSQNLVGIQILWVDTQMNAQRCGSRSMGSFSCNRCHM
ncbi:hypothetical protein K1719_037098 [Acacia pycnantha]|nr:hypothetical protein K1719_037098 [Acacia pycnantha]